jgi:hypothetical protein
VEERHAKVIAKLKEEAIAKSKEEAIAKLKETVENLTTQLNQPTENFAKLERSKKEMTEKYEARFCKEDEEEGSDIDNPKCQVQTNPTPAPMTKTEARWDKSFMELCQYHKINGHWYDPSRQRHSNNCFEFSFSLSFLSLL